MFSYKLDSILRLKLPDPGDAKEAAEVVRRNLSHLKPWMPWAVDEYSEDHAQDWIRRTLETFAGDGSFNALIILNDRIIGSIGFHDLDRPNRHASIGYWIDREHEGKGIITRCCRVLVDYLFDTMELNRLQINCNVENVRSRAIPERLGFKHEGVLRQVEFVDGRFRDWAVLWSRSR
jgi:ribosomal-protein-serine acetyltransferase